MNPYFNGTISNGQVKLNNKEQFYDYIRNFEGKVIQVLVKKYKSEKTLKQLAYLWGVALKLISEHTGHSTSELYTYCLNKYAPQIEVMGELCPKTARDFTSTEMSEFIGKVIMFGAELDVIIPDPEMVEV